MSGYIAPPAGVSPLDLGQQPNSLQQYLDQLTQLHSLTAGMVPGTPVPGPAPAQLPDESMAAYSPDYVPGMTAPSPISRVATAAAQGAAQGYGDVPSWSDWLYKPATQVIEAPFKAAGALFGAGQGAVYQGLQEVGAPETLARDVAALPEALLPEGMHIPEVGPIARQAVQTGRNILADTSAAVPNPLAKYAQGGDTAGVQFKPARTSDGYTTIPIDVGKVDASAAKDPNMYVGPGGAGGIKGRYQRFQDYLQTGQPVSTPEVSLGADGEISFGNGQHRFAVLRDQGATTMPVTVPTEDAAEIAQRFGPTGNALAQAGGFTPTDVRPPSEDVHDTMDASFTHGRVVGDQTVPLESLQGGVDLGQTKEANRVNKLAGQINSPDGYWSRPIVDTDGNVIEGQHRLEAARQLGMTNVPVHVVQDLTKGVDMAGLDAAVKQAQPGMHADQRSSLIKDALNARAEEGSAATVKATYDAPRGYDAAWDAALDHLHNQETNALGKLAAQPGVEHMISTRVPSPAAAKKTGIDPHSTPDLVVGYDSAKDPQAEETFEKNANLVRQLPGIDYGRTNSPQGITEKFINHVRDNLLGLYDRIPEQIRNRSMQWYDGANAIAKQWAAEHGYAMHNIAGALAALSPQKDWFQNVDLARRVIDTVKNPGRMFSPEMMDWLGKYTTDMAKQVAKGKASQASLDKVNATIPLIQGKTFGDLSDIYQRSLWLRAYDEAHRQKAYPLVTPEGQFGGSVMTGKNAPQKISWGSFNEIGKSLQALEAPDLPTISRQMGNNHKVRNFYNNIISPNDPHAVTIDTHAIAAGLLRPLGGGTPEVEAGLGLGGGAANNDTLGLRGLYPLYAEAYRRAAAMRGVLPRQMQSVTWEGVRGLFSPEQKRDATFVNQNEALWRGNKRGQTDATRQAIIDHAGGIAPPEWFGSGP